MRIALALTTSLALTAPWAVTHAQEVEHTERLSGSFVLAQPHQQVQQEIDRAILRAVEHMSFITRGVATSRLRRTNPIRRQMRTEVSGSQVAITYGDASYTTPNGEWRNVRDLQGNPVRLRQTARGDRIEQIFRSDDGEKLTVYRFSEDGDAVTLDITVTSPRLRQPLRYSLAYERAGRGSVAAR